MTAIEINCPECRTGKWNGSPDGRCDDCFFREEMETQMEADYMREEAEREALAQAWRDEAYRAEYPEEFGP